MLSRKTYLCLDVGTGILFDTKLFNDLGLWAQETEGKEDELSREVLFRSRNFFHFPATSAVFGPFNTDFTPEKLVYVIGVPCVKLPYQCSNQRDYYSHQRQNPWWRCNTREDLKTYLYNLELKQAERLTITEVGCNLNVSVISTENAEPNQHQPIDIEKKHTGAIVAKGCLFREQ